MFNVARNFLIGITLIPALIAVMFLYAPFVTDINILTGSESAVSEVIKEGYVVTQKDLQSIGELESVISELAMLGFMVGCFFALIEVALIVKRKIKRAEAET